jgi:hypothetical protein
MRPDTTRLRTIKKKAQRFLDNPDRSISYPAASTSGHFQKLVGPKKVRNR